jgi:DNA replication protein DnaC
MEKQISDIIQNVKQQLNNKISRTANSRFQFSGEEFRELFVLRAKEVMFEHKNYGEFLIDDHNREVLTTMYHYAVRRNHDVINSLAGIILNGAFGCGKSVLISAFCRVLNDINFCGDKIEEIHAIDLVENIRLRGLMDYVKKPLLIQDMGKEPAIINVFGTVIHPISNLLAIRAEYGAMTFGSTNMDIKMFSEHYREFITKRIVEHVNLVFLPGKSHRPDYSINQR